MSEKDKNHKGIKNSFYGKKHSEIIKKIISEKNRLQNMGELNPFYGKKHSENTKKKQSDSKKGKKLNERQKLKYLNL